MSFALARHPGGIIRRRLMEPQGLTMTDVASAMGVSVSSVSRLINEKAELSGDMALRLSHVFGGDPETWLTLQLKYNLVQAKAHFSPEGLTRLTPHIREENEEAEPLV